MSVGRSGWMGVVALAASLLWAGTASAESVSELTRKLREGDDFCIRTQAALALGASGDKAAVQPLCAALSDESDTVRAAAAAGLGRLARGGEGCLNERLASEGSKNVRKMIEKSLRLIDEAKSGPSISSSTRYYVSIGSVQNHTGRPSSEVAPLVHGAMLQSAQRHGGFAFAPAGEDSAKAHKILRKHPSLVGYRVVPELTTTKSGDQLSVACNFALLGYPEGDDLGSVGRSRGRSGVDPDDKAVEDALIAEACRESMDEFANLAAHAN